MKRLARFFVLLSTLTAGPTLAFAAAGACPCGSDCPCGASCNCSH